MIEKNFTVYHPNSASRFTNFGKMGLKKGLHSIQGHTICTSLTSYHDHPLGVTQYNIKKTYATF